MKHGNVPSIISFLSDPKGVLPALLGTQLTHPGPNDEKGLVRAGAAPGRRRTPAAAG